MTTSRLIAATIVAILVTACATDGRDLQDPADTPTSSPTDDPSALGPETPRGAFEFSSPSVADGGAIPVEYTCDGADTSPALSWNGVPFGAAELAVVVTDPEADFFTHWVITGLSPTSVGLDVDELPDGAVESLNSFGTLGWAGPCPPANHTYLFSLHILPEPLGMVPELEPSVAVGLVESATIQAINFTGTYGPAGS